MSPDRSSQLSASRVSAEGFTTGWEIPNLRAAIQNGRLVSLLGLGSWQGRLLWLFLLLFPVWLLDQPFASLSALRKNLLLGDIRDATRQFGEPVGIAWISIVIWFLDRTRRRPLLVALLAATIASGLTSGTKLLVGRVRPKVSEGRTILTGPHWPGTMKPDPSFPSGHSSIAFAFAYGMSRLHPLHRWLWVMLAAACAFSRALGEAHFLTDVLVGAWLGWEVARLVWDCGPGRWVLQRLGKRLPPTRWLPAWDWESTEPNSARLVIARRGV